MTRVGVFMLLVAISPGCVALFSGNLFGGNRGPVPLRPASVVRIQSGRATGSGCLLYSEHAAGAYVLTAAHLLLAPDRVLCRFSSRSDGLSWRSARVLRIESRRDLALLWVPRAVPGDIFRVAWAGSNPGRDVAVYLFVAHEAGAPRRISARAVAPGRLIADEPLAPGMSGAGVFREGRLAGVLFGQPRRGGATAAREGRYTGVDEIRAFLEAGFGFVIEGTPPAETR